MFRFKEDENTTPWHVSSPLNIAPTTTSLPKFKQHLPIFYNNDVNYVNEHLNDFLNACHNIGTNDKNTCMHLFVNSLKGKPTFDYFDLSPKYFSSWVKLGYWFN
jgi:hypothetical protein